MDIQVTYDSSAASAPSWFKSAVSYVVAQYDALITDPVTVKINVGWGEENGNSIQAGAAGDNQSNGTYMSYADLTKAMASKATTTVDYAAAAALPASDITGGGKFYVPLALQKALGVQTPSAAVPDGYVGLSSAVAWSFSPSGQIAAGSFDAIGVLEHEISQVLGRVDYPGQGSATGIYTPEDLFRYSAAGQRSLVSGSGDFSIDGQTMLAAFGNSGDASDWSASVIGDVFGNATAGVADHWSANDYTMLDVLGYTLDPSAPAAASATSNTLAAAANSTASASQPTKVFVGADSDVFATQGSQTFVFKPQTGDTSVSDFLVSDSDHDALNFSKQNFSSISDILRHTTMSDGNAVIHVSDNDTVCLYGVTKADLKHNLSDLKLHA